MLSDVTSTLGTISFTGSGTAILTGSNTYRGTTTVASGTTLQVGSGGTSGTLGSGGVINNGLLVFNRSDTIAVSNNISGTGSVSITGAGTASLSGSNTFSGGITVGVGSTLSIASASALGPGTLNLVGSPTVPAYLDLTASTSISNAIKVSSDPVFNIAKGTSSTMSGVISDGVSSGDVVVQGGGTLIMTGINTYTGLTSVASGTTLSLQGVGSIAQTVSLTNNGVLDLSSLTANANLGGTYTQGSAGTLGLRLTASGAQTLSITGAASLNGTLRLTAQSGPLFRGTYALITAGSVTGSFSNLSTNLGDYANSYELVYSSTSVSLLIGPSASNTKINLAANSVNLEQAMMERLLAMQSKLQYDCTTFDKYGVCLSASTRLNGTKTTENGGAILAGAYRVSPKWRVGGYVDQELTRHSPRDVRIGVPQPAFGAFVGYNENKNGLGFIARAAASISLGDVVVTRDSSLSGTEAGAGKARLNGYGFSAEIANAFQVANSTITPYAGYRYIEVGRSSYTENLVTGVVDYPLMYQAVFQRLASTTAGLKVQGMIDSQMGYQVSYGLEHHFCRSVSSYAGSSNISDLKNFSISSTLQPKHKTVASAATLFYQLDKPQRLSVTVSRREQAYVGKPAMLVLASYEGAF